MSSSGMAAQFTCTNGLVLAQTVPVDGARHQLLAHAALARDEHGRVRGRGPADRLPDLLQGRALAFHAIALVEGELQPPVLLHELPLAQRVPRHEQDALGFGRLLDEVVGPQLGGLHRRLHRAVPGEDDHGRCALFGLQGLQHLEPVHLRHLDVEEDEVGRFALGNLQRGRTVGGEDDLVPLVLEDHLEGRADPLFVVDDEHLGLHFFSTSTLVRNEPAGRGRYTKSQASSPFSSEASTFL